jgi:quercetin dioxygenase-like cupin family protein
MRVRSLLVAAALLAATAPSAQQPSTTRRIPQFENEHVRVWKSVIMPKQPLSMHRHERGRTIVALAGGALTIVEESGGKRVVTWETGKAYWLDADPPGTRHADVNETDKAIEVMVIELR